MHGSYFPTIKTVNRGYSRLATLLIRSSYSDIQHAQYSFHCDEQTQDCIHRVEVQLRIPLYISVECQQCHTSARIYWRMMLYARWIHKGVVELQTTGEKKLSFPMHSRQEAIVLHYCLRYINNWQFTIEQGSIFFQNLYMYIYMHVLCENEHTSIGITFILRTWSRNTLFDIRNAYWSG